MNRIKLLDRFVIDQITAGETVQRPASCLKELLENSVDAGATDIRVFFQGAGSILLEVKDNGFGMSREDAIKCIERHATSKISVIDDLYNLRTLGFRGEALASIAAVSKMEIRTRSEEDEIGTLVCVEGGEISDVQACVCPKGTDIKVKDLFYNIPVRRNFLKSDRTEVRNIVQIFIRVALVNTHIAFTVINEGTTLFDLKPDTLKNRIEQLFGSKNAKRGGDGFIDLKIDTDIVKISGLVSQPEKCNKLYEQYFFANGRYMNNNYFAKAVQNAYADIIPPNTFPSFFIYIDVPCDAIEVNIHPQKTELKFKDDVIIFQILQAGVREAIGKSGFYSVMDFSKSHETYSRDSQKSSNISPTQYMDLIASRDTSYNPFKSQAGKKNESIPNSGNEEIHGSLDGIRVPQYVSTEDNTPLSLVSNLIETVGLAGKYIVTTMKEDLYLVDYQRARVCVFYYEFLKHIHDRLGVTQTLLFPSYIDIPPSNALLFEYIKNDLIGVGYQIEEDGKNRYKILSAPSALVSQPADEVISHVLSRIKECEYRVRDVLEHELALIMAEEASSGITEFNDEDRKSLLQKLFSLTAYNYTPDGQKVFVRLTLSDLKKLF